jgi:hypothetical protein
MPRSVALLASLVLGLGGCASYVTPGGGASIPAITDADIGEALARRPAAEFPVQLIVARIQAPGYVSHSNRGYGQGSFSIVTTRDIETDEDFAQLGALPGVAAIGPISRLLLPDPLNSVRDLRIAAAQLHGDIVLAYTIDTAFHTDTLQIGPLQAVSLGFFPNKQANVRATCSMAFIDVRTGFVYGVAESSATEQQRSNYWSTEDAIEDARAVAERAAFAAAMVEAQSAWASILAAHTANQCASCFSSEASSFALPR